MNLYNVNHISAFDTYYRFEDVSLESLILKCRWRKHKQA